MIEQYSHDVDCQARATLSSEHQKTVALSEDHPCVKKGLLMAEQDSIEIGSHNKPAYCEPISGCNMGKVHDTGITHCFACRPLLNSKSEFGLHFVQTM